MNHSHDGIFSSSRTISITPRVVDGEKTIICEVYDSKTEAVLIWTSLSLDTECKCIAFLSNTSHAQTIGVRDQLRGGGGGG